jgi:DNA-directed RNA polymerase subunit RPC12/RpoP
MVTYTCSICNKGFIPQSLKLVQNQKRPKCDECHYARKAQVSLSSANKKAQTEMMSLERRIEQLEKKNEMLETIVESMVSEKVNALLGDALLSTVKQETNLQLTRLQNQIIELNNKLIKVNKNE